MCRSLGRSDTSSTSGPYGCPFNEWPSKYYHNYHEQLKVSPHLSGKRRGTQTNMASKSKFEQKPTRCVLHSTCHVTLGNQQTLSSCVKFLVSLPSCLRNPGTLVQVPYAAFSKIPASVCVLLAPKSRTVQLSIMGAVNLVPADPAKLQSSALLRVLGHLLSEVSIEQSTRIPTDMLSS